MDTLRVRRAHGFRWLGLGLFLGACAGARTGQHSWDRHDPFTPDLRQLDFGVGVRSMSDRALAPNRDATSLSLDYQDPLQLGPLALEGGLHSSFDRASLGPGSGTRELRVFEGSAGLRWNPFGTSRALTPYLGTGGSLLWARLTSDTDASADEDLTFGWYGKAGLLWNLPRGRHLGVEVRSLSAGTLTFRDVTADADSTEVLLIFGTGL